MNNWVGRGSALCSISICLHSTLGDENIVVLLLLPKCSETK